MSEQIEDKIKERKEKISKLIKQRTDWIYYFILGIIAFLSIYIRSRNISKLKDITTGTWTLAPDLDPFLFLRWAEYIVEHGKLMVIDYMRNVPLGADTSAEMKLLSYMIAWFHNVLSFLSFSDSVTYSAIIFPVFMAGLTAIAFFLFSRKIFYKEDEKTRNIIALISTLFFILMPSLLHRTIAGVPEKESAAFFFMFMAFYFLIESFTQEKFKKGLIFSILSGISTGLMALIWGGSTFVFMSISGAVFFAFILGKVNEKKTYYYALWVLTYVIVAMPFSTRYSLVNLLTSFTTGSTFVILFILLVDLILFKKKIIKFNFSKKIPPQIISVIFSMIFILLLAFILLGPNFIINQIKEIIESTVHPLNTSRFGLTVAENKQPFFKNDWINSFGPVKFGIPLFFWLFFVGSVVMFNKMIKSLKKKQRTILTLSYLVFLFCLIFSKYSQKSVLNGDSGLSLIVYFGGVLFFLGSFTYYYFKKYNQEEFSDFNKFNFGYILYFVVLTMAIMGARGAVRLIMVLAAINPIAVSYLLIVTSKKTLKEKEETTKFFLGILAVILILSSLITGWYYYQSDKYNSENFAPGYYQMQWQKTMAWVRNNTSENAVFAHWWDYGYWVQSIGKRATVLDGGNVIVYWNYLMGRNVLTATSGADAMDFLYTHNATHLLIDSTEIGKYTAFSSIGSDENYDRYSWISNFFMDESKTRETNNETTYLYTGGTYLDEDVVWKENGKEILFPERKAAVGAIILKQDINGKMSQPTAIFLYNNQQYNIPLKYLYYNNELLEFDSGIDSGIFIYPKIDVVNGQFRLNDIGAMYYLSKRTLNSNTIRLYLFNEDSNYFNLVHSEENLIIKSLNEQGLNLGEFVQYQGFQGPIKIWEIDYPSNVKINKEYLERDYPNQELKIAQPGKYSN